MRIHAVCALALAGAVACILPAASAEIPAWAFPVSPPGPPAPPESGVQIKLPGSTSAFTLTQILDRFKVVDWYPGEHPKMPPVVVNGRNPMRACAYCHMPSGAGRPENAALTGLTPNYFKQQVHNFRDGHRQGSEANRNPQNLMLEISKLVTDAEIDEAAAYYAKIKPVSYVRVVESATAPKTFVTGSILARLPEGGTEPLGNRIVEVPETVERFEHRDSKTPFTAYVPIGSIKRGADMAATGANGKTIPCTICHGPDLKGLGDVPPIAGRSPSFIVRQLFDMQSGKRGGTAALMQPVVAKLDVADMVALAAYAASLQP